MTLPLQEISDRLEIHDLIHRYAELIDTKQFSLLGAEVFTDDAHIDYSAFGGSVGDVASTIEFLESVMGRESGMFPAHQHLNANIQVRVDGDAATGKVMCFNPQEMSLPDGSSHLFMIGLWYHDTYRRTPAGWRIVTRSEERSWVFHTPEWMSI